jgi:outer membrane protein
MKKALIALACGTFLTLTAARTTAQTAAPKFGYISSQELLSIMPDVVKADTQLKVYAKTYTDQLENMGREFEKKAEDYQKNAATMTEAVREVKEKELTDLRTRFQSTEASANDKVAKKKEELYKPILEKADKAIKDVAKEKGYDYVFDASGGALLYAKDSDNIMPLVKAKLGIK